MPYGFLKTAVVTPDIRVADCIFNAHQMIKRIKQASAQHAQVVVLPELCMTGYTCGDLFLQQILLDGALHGLKLVLEQTADIPALVLLGMPLSLDGHLYNCAVVFQNGQILGVVPKTHLPNYGEFYEKRYFTPAPSANRTIRLMGKDCPFGTKLLFCCENQPLLRLAVEICEDAWVPLPPSVGHAMAGATVIANLSASDETAAKADYRRALVTGQSSRLICAYLYADAGEGESTTDLVFAGHNLIAENGALLCETRLFENSLLCGEIDLELIDAERRQCTSFPSAADDGYQKIRFFLPTDDSGFTRTVSKHPFIPQKESDRNGRFEDILSIQSLGLKKRLVHSHADTAVIGISGGLDSALAMLVAVRAMDRLVRPHTDILAITMPGFGTTDRTRDNAALLCEHLGVTLRQIDISQSVLHHFTDIGYDPNNRDVVFENAQARERTQVLMDTANQTNGLVVGTGDLSELALGWATYNGDHMSMYGVNASIPKTLIRHLIAYEAQRLDSPVLREVLNDILDTPVSPELLPASGGEITQKTEDLVGPYELHDFFLYYMLRWTFTPSKIFALACHAFGEEYPREIILKWLKTFIRRFFSQQFKRSCLPDGPKVGSVSLSPRGDFRMPSDACAALWLDELNRLN